MKRKSKPRRDDLTPWSELTDSEQQTFLSAYKNVDAWSARSKHSFLQEDGLKTLYAYFLSLAEKFTCTNAKLAELKFALGEGPRPPKKPDLFGAIAATLERNPQTKDVGTLLSETVLTYGFLMFVESRNWPMLEWLATYVKEHQSKPFPSPYLEGSTKLETSSFLRGIILAAFMNLSGSKTASLHCAVHPEPTHLPTKTFLRQEVAKIWKGADLAASSKNNFYEALAELGLSGLPEGKTGPKKTTRRDAAKARRLICGVDRPE